MSSGDLKSFAVDNPLTRVLLVLGFALLLTIWFAIGVCSTVYANSESEIGQPFRDCDGCPLMVEVPPGHFTAGPGYIERAAWPDSYEYHHNLHIEIGYRLAVGVYEVKRGEFARFVEATGHDARGSCSTNEYGSWRNRQNRDWSNPGYAQTDDHPVVCINWGDAQAYVKWLSSISGASYRLLSDSEWEYVARAGTVKARYWGHLFDVNQCAHVNGADTTTDIENRSLCSDGYKRTAPVGSFSKNEFGLYDVLGNVWEWVQDCWAGGGFKQIPTNGSPLTLVSCTKRRMRGGAWDSIPFFLRSAVQSGGDANERDSAVGFRVARTF